MPTNLQEMSQKLFAGHVSVSYDTPVELTFKNNLDWSVQMWWHDYEGNKVPYGIILPGQTFVQQTFATHPWSATCIEEWCTETTQISVGGQNVFVPQSTDDQGLVSIDQAFKSLRSDEMVKVTFANFYDKSVDLYWYDFDGNKVFFDQVRANESKEV